MDDMMTVCALVAVFATGVACPVAGQDEVKQLQERVATLESAVSKLEQCMGALHDGLGRQGYGRHPTQTSEEAKVKRDQEVAKLKAMALPELEKVVLQLYQREDEARLKLESTEKMWSERGSQFGRLASPRSREYQQAKPEERFEAFRSRALADNAQRSARQAYEEARQALQLAQGVYTRRLAELPDGKGQQPAGAEPARPGPAQP